MLVSSSVAAGLEGFQDRAHDLLGSGNNGGVVGLNRPDTRLHAFRHESLVVWCDHPIFLRQDVPGRHVLPEGRAHLGGYSAYGGGARGGRGGGRRGGGGGGGGGGSES